MTRLVIVTGAAGGMGRTCARLLGASARLVLTDAAEAALETFAGELGGEGYDVAASMPGDLAEGGLRARGSGAVGEMTTLISEAFRYLRSHSSKKNSAGKKGSSTILLIDEADALAQSRELAQMHHEDRAGVNALIRGIDDIAGDRLACLTIMCTNRLSALDPAIQRRAAAVFQFERPNLEMRQRLLSTYL